MEKNEELLNHFTMTLKNFDMTQEEKQLLLKDICGRLPYGLKGIHRERVHTVRIIEANSMYPSIKVDGYDAWFPIETFKPYLRPMLSMTKDEVNQYYKIRTGEDRNKSLGELDAELFNFYHKNHIDYRGLIEKGLALEAPEDMYSNNELKLK